jgi:hypothetical protein
MDPHLINPRSNPMKSVPTVTRIGLAPLAGPTLPWMNTTEGFPRPVDTVPGITTVNDRPFPSAGTTMTAMGMDVALPRVLGLKTTHPRVVPTRTHMMPGLRLLHAIMMTLIWRRGPTVGLARHRELTTLRMIGPATGRWRPISVSVFHS